MTFKELGETLQSERLRQGLSVDEVMQQTKVGRRHIEALEEGRIGDLPHPVYVKGFLKTYSSMLGLTIPEISLVVDLAYESVVEDNVAPKKRWTAVRETGSHSKPSKRARPEWIFIPIAVLLVAGIGVLLWFIFSASGKSGANKDASGKPALEQKSETAKKAEPAPVAKSEKTPASAQEPAKPAEEKAPLPSEPARAQTPPVEQPAAAEEKTGKAMIIASEEARAPQADVVHVLEILGDGVCWVEAKVDQNLTTDFYVKKGERVDVRFVKTLAVKFGDLNMVKLRYDGKAVSSPAPRGGVKTLTFPPRQ
jgi:cytoskeleton protein RodZ